MAVPTQRRRGEGGANHKVPNSSYVKNRKVQSPVSAGQAASPHCWPSRRCRLPLLLLALNNNKNYKGRRVFLELEWPEHG